MTKQELSGKDSLHAIFYGGVGSVTGSNFAVEKELQGKSFKIMIDCGLFQGDIHNTEGNTIPFPYDPQSFDILVVTHAHIDHIGRIPKLVKEGFKGKIISTPATKDIALPMFQDALKVMEYNSGGDESRVLYREEHIRETLSLWETLPYHEKLSLGEGFSLTFYNAGHILGSAMAEITHVGEETKRVVFTGDLGNSPSPLIQDTETISSTDYLVMESVYGDRNHEEHSERDDRFQRILIEAIERGGTIVIPAFSLERTQVILYTLNNLIEDKKIPKVPVYLDSPLAITLTEIYKKYQTDFNSEVKQEIKGGDDIFNFPGLTIVNGKEESESLVKTANPKIILAGSGMSVGGRVLSHEARILPGEKNTLIFVGYQASNTPGRLIQNGAKRVMLDGVEVTIKAHIETVAGYSSHKDSEHLVEFVSQISPAPKKVFLVMGEQKSSMFLAQRINDYLDIEAICPEKGGKYKI